MSLWIDAAGPNRRHAPVAAVRRDQRLRRGLWVVAALTAVLVTGLVAWLVHPEVSRHGFGAPHREAGLNCESCHAQDAAPHTRCVGCHGSHASTRPGHRSASQRGALRCTDCHRIHGDLGGVAFADGVARRFGPHGGEAVALPGLRPDVTGTVPVVPVAACARCHEPGSGGDPIARCLDATGTMSVCFDEHAAVRGETLARGGPQDRMVLWALATEVVARSPEPPGSPAPDMGLAWGTVALLCFVGLSTRAVWTRERRRARTDRGADVRPPERRRLPQIDATTCLGCSACVDACPYDVLALEDFVAKVARPSDCCGLTTCEERCPNGSLVVHDGEPLGDRPGVKASLESVDVPGLYLAGDLTGMPLIRNAINQGAVAVQSAASAGRAREPEALDLLIVGAGPAGLSAALEAKKQGLRYVVVEQGDLAQSIQRFPRGKLVFDQPLSVPLIGDLWLAESTKEELLRHWKRIVRTQDLPIRTEHRVTEILRDPGGFWVSCAHGDTQARFRAASVVLAIGRRGTPRTLDAPIAGDMEDRVFYSLADARSFAQRRCVVVGLGDVAMEAALALSYAPGTTVTVVARGSDFRRGKARNIEGMRAAEATGRLRIEWQSAVQGVESGAVVLEGPRGPVRAPADAVFVMIGAIAPWDFLQAVGVQRAGERKFDPLADPAPHSRVEPPHAGAALGRPEGTV